MTGLSVHSGNPLRPEYLNAVCGNQDPAASKPLHADEIWKDILTWPRCFQSWWWQAPRTPSAPTASNAGEKAPRPSCPHLPDSKQREPSPDPEPTLLGRTGDTAPTSLPQAVTLRCPAPPRSGSPCLGCPALPDPTRTPFLSNLCFVASCCDLFLPRGFIFRFSTHNDFKSKDCFGQQQHKTCQGRRDPSHPSPGSLEAPGGSLWADEGYTSLCSLCPPGEAFGCSPDQARDSLAPTSAEGRA